MTTAHALMSTPLSAEAIGVARWATDTASQYAKIREQFGRPIGQFQAIKHKCAEMIADTERATAAVWDAARAIDEAPRKRLGYGRCPSSPPRPWRPRCAGRRQLCTQDRIQVHGGIGFTWDTTPTSTTVGRCAGRLLRPRSDYPQQVVDTATSTGMRTVDID